MKRCTCAVGNPADYDGPDRDCPFHGDLEAQYGLRGGPSLLGRSYAAMANRVEAARDLAKSQGLDNRALELLDKALYAVARPTDEVQLHDALTAVAGVAQEWAGEVAAAGHGASEVWNRCPAYGHPPIDALGCDGFYLSGHYFRHMTNTHPEWWKLHRLDGYGEAGK